MLGWEYPPNFAGGLGIATQGIVGALEEYASVDLLLPRFAQAVLDEQNDNKAASNSNPPQEAYTPLPSPYSSYDPPTGETSAHTINFSQEILEAAELLRKKRPPSPKVYGDNLMNLVEQFAFEAAEYVKQLEQDGSTDHFDLIHAHDWMTFPAALKVKELTGKPLVLHIHSLETDRTVDPLVDNPVVRLERHAIAEADGLVAVSDYTKQELVEHYGAEKEDIAVVHNGTPDIFLEETPSLITTPEVSSPKIEAPPNEPRAEWPWPLPTVAKQQQPRELPSWMGDYTALVKPKQKVLFLGRVTKQKGPLTFLKTAKRLLEESQDLSFVVAGLGDQLEEMMQLAEEEKIEPYVEFKGFVERKAIRALLEESLVLFMPSASEPFGLVALEAAAMGLPIVASKQAGVMEVLPGVLTAEYWDSKQFARHLKMILEYPELREGLGKANKVAVNRITWSKAAQSINQKYKELLGRGFYGE